VIGTVMFAFIVALRFAETGSHYWMTLLPMRTRLQTRAA